MVQHLRLLLYDSFPYVRPIFIGSNRYEGSVFISSISMLLLIPSSVFSASSFIKYFSVGFSQSLKAKSSSALLLTCTVGVAIPHNLFSAMVLTGLRFILSGMGTDFSVISIIAPMLSEAAYFFNCSKSTFLLGLPRFISMPILPASISILQPGDINTSCIASIPLFLSVVSASSCNVCSLITTGALIYSRALYTLSRFSVQTFDICTL